jgi:hypothetical protein
MLLGNYAVAPVAINSLLHIANEIHTFVEQRQRGAWKDAHVLIRDSSLQGLLTYIVRMRDCAKHSGAAVHWTSIQNCSV